MRLENRNKLDINYIGPQQFQKIIHDKKEDNIINVNKEIEESNQIDKAYCNLTNKIMKTKDFVLKKL